VHASGDPPGGPVSLQRIPGAPTGCKCDAVQVDFALHFNQGTLGREISMGIAFMSVAFGRNPVTPMKPDIPVWIIERHISPGSHGVRDRYRH
jgi:hypothetical protein